ncbi:MAG: oligoendopeptidase F [Candidatus Hydrogenedentes bacterium]|nr:oligoendopeptidase F [Candidatus Hydrogenedentota bacterium]
MPKKSPNKKVPLRKELPVQFTWDLSPVFKNDEEWEREFKRLEKQIPKLEIFRGHLSHSPDTLRECLELLNKLNQKIERLTVYANLKFSEDLTNTKYAGYSSRVQYLGMLLAQASSYITPEIQAISDVKFNRFSLSPKLTSYRFFLKNLRRFKPHTLSEREERLLALHTEACGSPGRIFEQLNDADLKFGEIKDKEGNKIELSHATFRVLMENPDRDFRRRAFFQYYKEYEEHANTLSASLSSSILEDIFHARARNFNSALESALFEENIPIVVYHNLLESVKNNLNPYFEYLKLRKNILQLKELHAYDLYVPIGKPKKKKIKYEEAVDIITEALKPLGEKYVKILREGLLEKRWVDRYENKGKRSGAFSWGCYRCPPYILMNYKDEVEDSMFTLAHEAGHSMHSYFSDKAQKFHYSHYSVFVAEVASTVNEQLLINYLLRNTSSREEKIHLINKEIDEIRTTLIRQTMFAEFELVTHTLAEQGTPLTLETFRNAYRKILDAYFGGNMFIDKQLELECLRIPHFYHAFYVYKYATGISSAISIAKSILSNDKTAQKKYLKFLSLGGYGYPLEQLREAGVDLKTPKPIQVAMNHLAERVSLLKELLIK